MNKKSGIITLKSLLACNGSMTKSQTKSNMTAVYQNMNSPPSYQKYGMEDFFAKCFLYSMHLFQSFLIILSKEIKLMAS